MEQISNKIDVRIADETKYNVAKKALRCCHSTKGDGFWLWLVDATSQSLFRSEGFAQSRPAGHKVWNENFQKVNRYGIIPNGSYFSGQKTILEVETEKNTKLGRENFKNIDPDLPLEPQIRNAHGRSTPLDAFGFIQKTSSGVNVSVWPAEEKGISNNLVEKGFDDIPDEIEGASGAAANVKIIAQNKDFFARHSISQKRAIVLGDEQKEVMFSHMFDNKVLVINGGPGTGKTATMIQRLKLLIDPAFYEDSSYTEEDFKNGSNIEKLRIIWKTFLNSFDPTRLWAFFSPTLQLKNFLTNNLDAEGLGYSIESTKVWNEKGKFNSSEVFIMSRDLYHFVNLGGFGVAASSNRLFADSPEACYNNFCNLITESLKAEYQEKFASVKSVIDSIGDANLPTIESLMPRLDSIESFVEYMIRFDDDYIDDTYKALWGRSIGYKSMQSGLLYDFARTGCSEIRSKIFAGDSKKRFFRWSLLLFLVEKNNSVVFNAVKKTIKAEEKNNQAYEDDDEISIFEYFNAFKDVMSSVYGKKSFKKVAYEDGLINDSFTGDYESVKATWNYRLNQIEGELAELEPKFEESRQRRNDLHDLQKNGKTYNVEELEQADLEFEELSKTRLKLNRTQKTLRGWMSFDCEDESSWVERYEELTCYLLRELAVSYITDNFGTVDLVLRDFSICEDMIRKFSAYRELQDNYSKAISKTDLPELFIHKIKALYEGKFRSQCGFSELMQDGRASIQPQEYSFLIFFGNRLAKMLYKRFLPKFEYVASIEDDMVKKHRENPDENELRGYTVVSGYQASWRVVIGIDEATDYTRMEIAAMASLGHPRYSCVTLAGDLMQAFNENGITKWEMLNDGVFDGDGFEEMPLNISYRQSPTLLAMANKIYSRNMNGKEAPYRSKVDGTAVPDPLPLLFKSDSEEEKIAWIAQKIMTLHKSAGILPATAIFYPSERKADVEEFAERLNGLLWGLTNVETCYGADMNAKVVVYPISLVKGLEFEAAFFYGLDSVKNSKLLDTYMYVALSRATYYMAATSDVEWEGVLAKDFTTDESESNWPK